MKTSTRSNNIAKLKIQLSALNDERTNIIFQLLHGKSMILGIPRDVYRKCGKQNCKCTRGFPHGPYPSLSINKNGRQKTVMVKKADSTTVLLKAERYSDYQKNLARIRKINKEIDTILVGIKNSLTVNYPPGV